jgi:hypothetical protein
MPFEDMLLQCHFNIISMIVKALIQRGGKFVTIEEEDIIFATNPKLFSIGTINLLKQFNL